jgi:hypothetical protein
MRRDATAGDLALAFRGVWELRNMIGDFASNDQEIPVRGNALPLTDVGRLRYNGYLERLGASMPREVEGINVEAAYDVRLGHVRHPVDKF